MSTAPTSFGWAGDTRGERKIEPTYTPDLAGEIDGDGEEQETDFYVAAELLREILTFCYAYRGDKPQPDLKVAFMRFTCVTWLVRPELVGNLSLAELGPQLGYTRANLSKLIRDFGDRLGGLRNRLQKTEGARQIYSEAQKRDHWRNRKKQTPAAPCGTTGAHADHSKNGTNHPEGST
jgi:hypothetical protein